MRSAVYKWFINSFYICHTGTFFGPFLKGVKFKLLDYRSAITEMFRACNRLLCPIIYHYSMIMAIFFEILQIRVIPKIPIEIAHIE